MSASRVEHLLAPLCLPTTPGMLANAASFADSATLANNAIPSAIPRMARARVERLASDIAQTSAPVIAKLGQVVPLRDVSGVAKPQTRSQYVREKVSRAAAPVARFALGVDTGVWITVGAPGCRSRGRE